MATMIRRAVPLLTGAVIAVAAAVGIAAPAYAHNYLVSSTPTEGETLTELPDAFVITTNDALLDLSGEEAGGFAIQVTDATGLFYGDGCIDVEGPSMMTAAALGAPGQYTLAWQSISADGHTISDQFTFGWQPATDAPVSEGSATAPACGESVPAEPTPDAEPSETPPSAAEDEAAPEVGSDLLWVGGAAVAVLAAAVTTMFVLSRKKK